MMSSKQVQSPMYPVAQSRMPTLEGTIGSLHRFPSNQALQYSGAYYTYDAVMKDRASLPHAWSPSNSALLNGRNPMSHFPKGPLGNHVAYRPQNVPFSAEGNRAPFAQQLSAKQGFTYYSGSPGVRSRTDPAPLGGRKHTAAAGSLSPASGNSPYLTFPKPVYGYSPSCSELGCSAGCRYGSEHGPQRADPGGVYEDDWVLHDHRALLQGKNRAMQLDHSRLPPRAVEEYLYSSPDGKRTLPAFIEPNYSAYPCATSHSLVVPPTEHCQNLQIPPKALHGLYPSHPPTYKHRTALHRGAQSQLYQDHSHMAKYGQLEQQPVLYYSQANVEVESRVAYKDVGGKHREDVDPSVHKHTPPTPTGHYLVSQPTFSDVPMPGPMAPPNDAFLRGFDHGSYPAYRMRFIAGQMRSVLERQTMDQPSAPPHTLHMDQPSTPPHGLHMDQPSTPPHGLHMDQPSAPPHSLHIDRPNAPPHSLHIDRPSAPPHSSHMDRPSPPPHSLHMDRPSAPSHSLHMDWPSAPPHSLHMDRPSAPPYSLHMDWPSAPPHSLHMDRSSPPPYSLHMDRPSPPPHSSHMDRPSPPPHSSHVDRPSPPPHSSHVDRPSTPPHSSHVDRPSTPPHSLHMDQRRAPPHSLHMDRPSPPPHSLHMDRSSAPPHDLHMERLRNPPTSRQSDRALDFSQYSAPATSPWPHQGHTEVQRASLTKQSPGPCDCGNHNHTTALKSTPNPLRITGSPLVTSKEYHIPPPNVHVTDSKSPKRCLSNGPLNNQPTSSTHEEDGRAVKRLKVEADPERADSCCRSPSMPVISNVFSLAPYRAYLQAMGMLPRPPPETHPAEHRGGERGVQRYGEKPAVRLSSPEEEPVVRPDTPQEKPVVKVLEPRKIKEEPRDQDCPSEAPDCRFKVTPICGSVETRIEEVAEKGLSNRLILVIKKIEPEESESRLLKPANDESAIERNADPLPPARERARSVTPASSTPQPCERTVSSRPKYVNSPQLPADLQKIPPQSLKLSIYRIVLPDVIRDAPPAPRTPERPQPAPRAPERPQPAAAEAEVKPAAAGHPGPARQHFLELHQILCRLLSSTVSQSPEQEVRSWLSTLEQSGSPSSPSAKAQNVSGLLGAKVRDVWLSDEKIKAALQKVQQRLREYIGQRHSPFPHVVRAGAMFIPMLVVKEVLFPQVQGSFIDQVLQEHKVELRPTTLSEEKILTQLHKRASSSKLRRLLSLKHLPEIYPDVLNLFYHSCVCKRLGVKMDGPTREGREEGSENVAGSRALPCSPATTSPTRSQNSQQWRKDLKRGWHLKKHKRSNRKKRSPKSVFLESSALSEGEEVEHTEQGGNWSVVKTFSEEDRGGGSGRAAVEEHPSVMSAQDEERRESWTCPLRSEELSSSSSNDEMERGGTLPCGRRAPGTSRGRCHGHSGMILKLRRVLFDTGRHGGEKRYQAISAPVRRRQPLLSEAEDGGRGAAGDEGGGEQLPRRTASPTPRTGQRAVSLSHTLHLKIRYCPYLSACHSAEHRGRWVLRSAVQEARRAIRMYYPDLVGKRIQHLYEEMDKTEVWYRGLVVRVHEQHPNPLKTVFEVQYDSEPGWQYYLELLIDYKKGWLKIDD